MPNFAPLVKAGAKGVDALVDALRSFKFPQDEAMALAQQRAALPVEKGGLGLGPANTAAERAKAMGFDTDLLHGTVNDFPSFKVSNKSNVYATSEPNIADIYANAEGRHKGLREVNAGPNVIPLKARGKILEVSDLNNGNAGWFNDNIAKELGIPVQRGMVKEAQKHGYDFVKINDLPDLGGVQTQYVFPNPENLRSQFAAFDPFRKTAATAAAMGVAAPDLLAEELRNK